MLLAAPLKDVDKAVLACAVAANALLCTNGSSLLASTAQPLDIEHQPVNRSKGQRVRGPWHVQNVNAYQSRLKH